jgi:hypothetical protein
MSKKSIGLAVFALGCVVASGLLAFRGAADASGAIHRPLTFQQGRADAFACPTPTPGAKSVDSVALGGRSGKIVTVPGTTQFFSTVNCPAGQVYLYHGLPPAKPIVTHLRLADGATGAQALGVAENGEVVGFMLFGTRERPYRWVNGEAIALRTPGDGLATAIAPGGLPIVGDVVDPAGVLQGYWFGPAPGFFIPPAGASLVNAVRQLSDPLAVLDIYAGELGGVAAAAFAPGSLKQLPIGHPSTALAVNGGGLIVGRLALTGTCEDAPRDSGFEIKFPNGRPSLVPHLAGDCTSSALDVNDGGAIVGNSGLPAVQRAEGFNLIGFAPGVVDLNASTRYAARPGPPPWAKEGHRLVSATGIDERGDIAATDSAGEVWFLHIP